MLVHSSQVQTALARGVQLHSSRVVLVLSNRMGTLFLAPSLCIYVYIGQTVRWGLLVMSTLHEHPNLEYTHTRLSPTPPRPPLVPLLSNLSSNWHFTFTKIPPPPSPLHFLSNVATTAPTTFLFIFCFKGTNPRCHQKTPNCLTPHPPPPPPPPPLKKFFFLPDKNCK